MTGETEERRAEADMSLSAPRADESGGEKRERSGGCCLHSPGKEEGADGGRGERE